MPRRARIDGLLRNALAPMLGLSAAELQFGREAKGRPFLRRAQAPDFNLSHTVGGTVIALCRQGRIGVDLERVARQLSVARLAARYFGDEEASELRDMASDAARWRWLRLSPSSEHTAVLALRDAPPLSIRVYRLID